MPSISAIVLAALAGAGALPADPPSVQRADYRAAFDDAPEYAPPEYAAPEAWPTTQPDGRRAAPAARPAHLPIQFHPAPQPHNDRNLIRTAGSEPGAPARLAADERAIPLAPPTPEGERAALRLPTASIPTVVGSLGAVVGLFLIVAWIMRRGMPKGSGMLPREVVEVLGRAPLAGRQQLHLLRLGNKLLLVSMSQTSVETLAEITDPLEVDRLTGLCYQTHPQGSTASFRQVFQSFEDPRAGYSAGRVVDRLDLSQLDAIALGGRGKEGSHGR